MKNTAAPFTLVFAAICVATIVWLWPRSNPERMNAERAPAAPVASTTPDQRSLDTGPVQPTNGGNDAAVRALLGAVQRMLARRDVRPNESVLSFKDDAALARFLARAGKAGLTVIGQLDGLRSVRVRFDDVRALQAELAQNPDDYADVSANYVFSVPAPPKEDRPGLSQVPFRNSTLAFIGATGDRTTWGRGVTIAVLDTGIGSDPTFGSGRVAAMDIGLGTSPGKGAEDWHGTSVASLAGGMTPDAAGVSPAANLLSIRVTDANGTSDIFTLSQAIVTAADAGAKVINVSLGGFGTNLALSNAIDYAIERGAVIVAAAGNNQAAQLNWPAADPRVVSVGAVDRAEQQVTFSNSGPQLSLSAPGYGVQTAYTNGERAYVDGTSASAPLVSGAIAALLSQNPSLSPADAVQLLTRTASDAGAPGADPAFGNGILNLGWAMNLNNPAYIDTAVASHYYDAANGQMDFVVQNRSGRSVSGLSLSIANGATTTTQIIPTLSAGQTQVFKVAVDAAQLKNGGSIQYTTTLVNPVGIVDALPDNNRRTSVLTAPVAPKK